MSSRALVRGWIPLVLVGLIGCKSTPKDAGPAPEVAPKAAAPATPAEDAAPSASGLSDKELKALSREAYYGMYVMGRKAGFAHIWTRPSQPGEPGRIAMGMELSMAVSGGGNSNKLEASELRFYSAEAPHPLVETRFRSTAMGFEDVRRGVVTDGRLRITRTLDGKVQERELGPTADTLMGQLNASPLSLAGLEVGKVSRAVIFNWELEADEEIEITVESLETRTIAGIEERVATLASRYLSTKMTGRSVTAEGGVMLEMTVGPGLLLKLEEASLAKSGVAGMDILGVNMPSPTRLGSPHQVSKIELVLTSSAEATLPSTPNQRVETSVADGVATHTVVLTRGPGAAVAEDELASALAADSIMDVQHEAIQAKAAALTEGLTTPREKVAAIAAWVYQSVDKKLATHLPTASLVLEKLVGDCTEHTWLTVALLRAQGIAARPVYGVGYTGDVEGVFAYHAWVEVALDGHWEMIDPTWNQTLADATHLRMGESLGEVAAAIGSFTIQSARVLEP